MRFRHRMACRLVGRAPKDSIWRDKSQLWPNAVSKEERETKQGTHRNTIHRGNLKQVPGRLDHTARPVLEHSRWILICIVAVDRLPRPYTEWVIEYDVNGCFLRGYTCEAKTSKISLKPCSSSKYGAKESEHRY